MGTRQYTTGKGLSPVLATGLLALFACVSLALWTLLDNPTFKISALAATGTFAAIALGLASLEGGARLHNAYQKRIIARITRNEHAHCFLTREDGRILFANRSARKKFDPDNGQDLAARLRTIFAGAEGIVFRLKQKAMTEGFAREEITSHAESFGMEVGRISRNLYLWRLKDQGTGHDEQMPHHAAILSVAQSGTIVFANTSARKLLGQRPERLEDIFTQLPLIDGSVHQIKSPLGLQAVHVRSRDIGAGRMDVTLIPVAPEMAAVAEQAGSFDTLPVPLLKVAPNGEILRSNAEARRLLRISEQKAGNLAEHMEGLGRAIGDWLLDASEGRGKHRSEFLRLTSVEREVFVQVTLNRVVENGQPALIAVLNDATEIKTIETQIVQSQKMQAIGQLAGGVAHDFNNLLTAISGHCDLLLLRHDQGDPDYGDLVQINQNTNRAAALVGQLLAFSRKQTMMPELLDLRDTLSELTHLLNRLVGEKVQLTLRHDDVLPNVRGDRRQLEQVLMNLVVNARDAMPEGGEIVVETERRVLRTPLTRDRVVVDPGVYVCVRVSDEGTGIPEDKLQKIFEPFFTTKSKGEGTGLGLSTVYGIVKQSGAFIFVDSMMGQGTCFTLLFPAHEAVSDGPALPRQKEPAPTRPPARKLAQKGSGVVLLVEDEAPVRAFAARALRLRGYTVLEAENAEEALAKLADEDLNVDIFVTDVVMPGLDGPSWVRKARESRPDTGVVFVSGYAEDVFGEGSEEVPNSAFLAKPFSLNELTEIVHERLNEPAL